MVRNTLMDLNNHLFEQMERLNDDGLTDESLKREMQIRILRRSGQSAEDDRWLSCLLARWWIT